MTELTKRERMKMTPTEMPERDAKVRATSFMEVNFGYTPELATLEAQRCLLCAHPVCIDGCPVGINISEFIHHVALKEFTEAAEVIGIDNSLPAVCGRVCAQEVQCEGSCVLDKKGKPIHIGHLERFVADFVRENSPLEPTPNAPATGKRVAVVGSGPAGLACASDLITMGHEVVVFEALHELGGVLVYGIPEFRLPKDIVKSEIDGLANRGVEFRTNTVIGSLDTLDDLLDEEGFDAVFIGVGAGLPKFLNVPGENLIGVYSANEFLTRINLMKAYMATSQTPILDMHGKNVVVFGGGNTAMDAVRTALRLGAGRASIAYRRTMDEMPARVEEVHHAQAEGVEFDTLISPLELLGDDDSNLVGVRLQRMELGEPGEDGRRRPQPIEGDIFEQPADIVVIAIGNVPNPLLLRTTPDLDRTKWGTLVADDATGRTSKKGVFGGGDIVTGGATVILAMGAGRRAAASIGEFLTTGEW